MDCSVGKQVKKTIFFRFDTIYLILVLAWPQIEEGKRSVSTISDSKMVSSAKSSGKSFMMGQ